jgi:hypothetical protein
MKDSLVSALSDVQVAKDKPKDSERCGGRRRPILLFIGSLACVGVVFGYSAAMSGATSRAIAYLSGQRVFVEPKVDLGVVQCGGEMVTKVEIFVSAR